MSSLSRPLCPCGAPAVLVNGHHVYPHRPDLAGKWFWVHDPCDTRVGCHPDTIKPLGSLVDAATRRARQRAHAAFDPIWQDALKRSPDLTRHRARGRAYRWLAGQLGRRPSATHIAQMDIADCERVIAVCEGREALDPGAGVV